MKKFLVINGPNLNMLGKREPALYGKENYRALLRSVRQKARELGVKVRCFQSNEEGKIVTKIQKARGRYDGIVLNAGAYTHTSLAILDALKAAEVPTAEVHLTDIKARESYRAFSFVAEYACYQAIGKGITGYGEALEFLASKKD